MHDESTVSSTRNSGHQDSNIFFHRQTSDILEPTSEVVESLKHIEKLAEKQNSKSRTKKRLGSLKRLFSTGSRRVSSSAEENEYLPTPSGFQSGSGTASQPTTPTRVTNNMQFRLSTDSTKSASRAQTLNKPKTSQLPPLSPAINIERKVSQSYYNVSEQQTSNKPPILRTPVRSTKPPSGVSQTPQRHRSGPGAAAGAAASGAGSRLRSVSSSVNHDSVWPGMEAPPLPQLHKTCRGYKDSDMPNIVILFYEGCNESRKWREYLGKELQTPNRKVAGQRLGEFGEVSSCGDGGQGRKCEEVMYHCDLLITIISSKFVSWIEKTRIVIGKLMHPSRMLALFINIGHESITPSVANCLLTLPCWKSVVIDSGEQEKSIFEIGKHCEDILRKQERSMVLPNEPKFKIFPRKVSPGQSKIMVILDETVDHIEKEQFQMKVTQDDFHFTIEEAKWIKDDLVQLEIPASMCQSTMIATLNLSINENHFGSRQIKIENSSTQLENAWQQCTDPVTAFSDAFDVRFVNYQDIDEFLSANLEKKMKLEDMLKTKYNGCCNNQTDCIKCLNKDHTKLLHFAASHGFSRLCHSLLSAGYQRYLTLPNLLGLTPAECAEKNGHHSLAQKLRTQVSASSMHEYQYPTLGAHKIIEGEDGYLLPQGPGNQSFGGKAQSEYLPVDPQNKVRDGDPDDFYQVPPAPVPLKTNQNCASLGTSLSSSNSTPPKLRMSGQGGGYIEMLPPIRKASSDLEPKSKSTFDIPKSGSFSHFTSNSTTMKPSEQLIKKYCLGKSDSSKNQIPSYIRPFSTPPESNGSSEERDQEKRPESSPPVLLSSQNIFIPVTTSDMIDSNEDSSPLEHYVHTDGSVHLPIESHEDIDPELSALFENNNNLNSRLGVDKGKNKTLLARLSPSRTKLMRSMRRRSGGSSNNEDNENEIDPIIEVNENYYDKPCDIPPKLAATKSDPSRFIRNEENENDYDVPRQLSCDNKILIAEDDMFTKVKKKSGTLKSHNIGAYENVIIHCNTQS